MTRPHKKQSEALVKSNRWMVDLLSKIKGYPYWPAKVLNIDSVSFKTVIKYEVEFFETKETNTVNENNICSYKENKLNHPLESVAPKYKDTYKLALIKIKKAWEAENELKVNKFFTCYENRFLSLVNET